MQPKLRHLASVVAIVLVMFVVSRNPNQASAAANRPVATVASVKNVKPVVKTIVPVIKKTTPQAIFSAPVLVSPTPVPTNTPKLTDNYNTAIVDKYTRVINADGSLTVSDQLDGLTYKVTVPEANAKELADYRLRQLKVCSKQISAFIGQAKPYTGNVIAEKIVITPTTNGSYCCDNTPDNAIINQATDARFQDLAYSPTAFWRTLPNNVSICMSGHEETHRFVKGTIIENFSWVNEGLATIVEQNFRGPGTLAIRTLKECNAENYRAIGFTGIDQLYPYRTLSELNDQPRIYSYYTYACLWDRIDSQYGHEKFKKVIADSFSIPFANPPLNFWQAVLEANLDSNIWTFLGRLGITRSN